MDHTQVLGLEIPRYTLDGDVAAYVPRIVGLTTNLNAQKKASASVGARRKWDEASFKEAIEANLEGAKLQAARKFISWTSQKADSIAYGTGAQNGSLIPRFLQISKKAFVYMYSNGSITIGFDGLSPDVNKMKTLRSCLAKRISVADITDVNDEDITKCYKGIPSDYVAEHVDEIIAALNEFIEIASDQPPETTQM
jgi:sulfite reductase beta subunit-like hemoprotein